MKSLILCFTSICCLLFLFAVSTPSGFADDPVAGAAVSEEVGDQVEKETAKGAVDSAINDSKEAVNDVVDIVKTKTDEYSKQVDTSEEAKKYSAGILEPIYSLAEYMSFSSFHWLAFAFMVSGVISFSLQLVLGKLAVLMRGGLSFSQILTDLQGLVISLVGLFLTTQAAAENSSFTTSPAAVLSATGLGLVAGFYFYLRGQATELEALEGRREEARISRASQKRSQ